MTMGLYPPDQRVQLAVLAQRGRNQLFPAHRDRKAQLAHNPQFPAQAALPARQDQREIHQICPDLLDHKGYKAIRVQRDHRDLLEMSDQRDRKGSKGYKEIPVLLVRKVFKAT
jgi:hypothetical protein